jgi:Trypsin-co-occurring domain 2
MAEEEIGLQDLIYQVKRDLLTPNQAAQTRDPFPLFAIEKIELEIAVKITRERNGSTKITVLEVIELSGGQTMTNEHGHVVKVTLVPLIPMGEIAADVLADTSTREEIKRDLRQVLLKGDGGLAGEPE